MPLAQALSTFEETAGGIDEAVARLEQAFERLEHAAHARRSAHTSLKEDHAKLNHLLQDADAEIGRLREAVFAVSERLERTIVLLEQNG